MILTNADRERAQEVASRYSNINLDELYSTLEKRAIDTSRPWSKYILYMCAHNICASMNRS